MSLSNTKATVQLYYCPDGLLAKLSAFHAECPGSNPAYANFTVFS